MGDVRDQEPPLGISPPIRRHSGARANRPRARAAHGNARGAGSSRRGARACNPRPRGTLVTAHSEKRRTTGTREAGFGLNPRFCYLEAADKALVGMVHTAAEATTSAEPASPLACSGSTSKYDGSAASPRRRVELVADRIDRIGLPEAGRCGQVAARTELMEPPSGRRALVPEVVTCWRAGGATHSWRTTRASGPSDPSSALPCSDPEHRRRAVRRPAVRPGGHVDAASAAVPTAHLELWRRVQPVGITAGLLTAAPAAVAVLSADLAVLVALHF